MGDKVAGDWRQNSYEIRALSISGLLVSDVIGGQSVKPYQPAGYWQHLNFPQREWQADSGQNLYRRGLYTFLVSNIFASLDAGV